MASAQKVGSTAQFPGEKQPELLPVVPLDSISACALQQRIDQVSGFRTAGDPQESGTSLAKSTTHHYLVPSSNFLPNTVANGN
jgi:hypothetical protein